ncbi:hypothetical protein Tco_0037540 [Tanacetum coccineum]
MALCTNLQNMVLALEYTKTTQAQEIDSLKRRDRGLGEEDASKQGRKIHDIDADEDITLENVHDEDMFDTNVFNDKEVFAGHDMAEKEVSTVDPVTSAGEVVTTANVEVKLKSARPKTKGVVMQEASESTTTTTTTTTTTPSNDKGKGIMVE